MSALTEIRRQQQLRAAEGYLDLITVFEDRWSLTPEYRDRVAARALDTLNGLPRSPRERAYVYYLKGHTLRTMERYHEAVRPLLRAAKLEPENFHVFLALGWCYKRIERLDLAIESLEEAMGIAPDEVIIHYNLACYWSLAGNTRLALQYLSQAFDLDPDYRDRVAEETDFDPIRNDPEFRMVTSVIV